MRIALEGEFTSLSAAVNEIRLRVAALTGRFFREVAAVRTQHAAAHPRPADEMDHPDAGQTQTPAAEQRKGSILAQAFQPGRGIEKDDRLLPGRRPGVCGDLTGHPADSSYVLPVCDAGL